MLASEGKPFPVQSTLYKNKYILKRAIAFCAQPDRRTMLDYLNNVENLTEIMWHDAFWLGMWTIYEHKKKTPFQYYPTDDKDTSIDNAEYFLVSYMHDPAKCIIRNATATLMTPRILRGLSVAIQAGA